MRASQPLFDEWAEVGGDRWKYANLLPSFRAIEDFAPNSELRGNVNLQQRGQRGPLNIRQTEDTPLGERIARATAQATGAPIVQDYNAGVTLEVSDTVQLFQRDAAGTRSFGADFLEGIVDAQGRGLNGLNIRVRSEAKVDRLLFDDDMEKHGYSRPCDRQQGHMDNNKQCGNSEGLRAAGVRYLFENKVFDSFSDTVVLCAGVNDFAILERSGIGQPEVLRRFGIPVRIANANVGAHLTTQIGPVMVIGTNNAGLVQQSFRPTDLGLTGVSFVRLPSGTGGINTAGRARKIQVNSAAANTLNPTVSQAFGINAAQNPFTLFAWDLDPQSEGENHITSRQITEPFDVICFFCFPFLCSLFCSVFQLLRQPRGRSQRHCGLPPAV